MTASDPHPPGDPLRAHSDRMAAIVEEVGAAALAVLGRRGAIASACVWRPGLVVTALWFVIFWRFRAAFDGILFGEARLEGERRRA